VRKHGGTFLRNGITHRFCCRMASVGLPSRAPNVATSRVLWRRALRFDAMLGHVLSGAPSVHRTPLLRQGGPRSLALCLSSRMTTHPGSTARLTVVDTSPRRCTACHDNTGLALEAS
jgi:hypothetical protein